MDVYLIPEAKAKAWMGVYNGDEFQPVKDAAGNYVVSVETNNPDYPFMAELKKCKIIPYNPVSL